MNSRLQQFLSAENISQSQFADTIGVARASVSHILAGRNRPGFDFIESMALHFPAMNMEWFITGKGKMYKGDLSQKGATVPTVEESLIQTPEESLFPEPETVKAAQTIERRTLGKTIQNTVKQRSIARIIVFYDDNSFEELK